jgi:Tol biopolymer transport system component
VSGSVPLPPIWTPDGRIVFAQQLEGHRNIWITNADGTNQKQLTMAGNNYYPCSHAVWTMDIDGGNQAVVVRADGISRPQLGIAGDPQLSPDGTRIFIAGGSGPWSTLR